tara:strand:- start:3110 stop:3703 length:594 start_codon:yes stop_codon:yes gene_type:complete
MVAVFSVYFDTVGTDANPGSSTDVDALGAPALRFKTNDNTTIDAIDPVPVPSSGTNYSYWKQIYLKCDTAPDTQVDNIKFYTDGSGFGTGITLNVGLQFPTKNSGSTAGYEVASTGGTSGTTGIELTAGHALVSSVASAFNYTSGSPLTGPTISEDSSIINAQNETTNYLILQVAVAATASPGNKTDETLTFQYDEI